MSCKKCEAAPYTKQVYGCEAPSQVPARHFGDEDEDDWYSCPLLYIPQVCMDFESKYWAYKNQVATPPNYEIQSAKFNEGVKLFEYYMSKYVAQGK